MNKLDGVKGTFGPVRFSFVNVFEKKAFNNNDPQYSLRALIPKENTALVEQIQTAIARAKEEGRTQLWGGNMPGNLVTTIHDGDETGRPEESGCWCLNTNNKNRQPGVVAGADRHRATPEEIKSGDYGLINITFKAFDRGTRGVSCYLNSVWKTKTGDSLTGSSTPEEDFKDVDVNNIEFDDIEVDPLTGLPVSDNAPF